MIGMDWSDEEIRAELDKPTITATADGMTWRNHTRRFIEKYDRAVEDVDKLFRALESITVDAGSETELDKSLSDSLSVLKEVASTQNR